MYEELVTWMRYCAEDNPICEKMKLCPFYDKSEENNHYYLCGERMLKKAADAIEDLEKSLAIALLEYQRANNKLLMTEKYAEQKQRWIPVAERLPEPYTWVLVSAENHKVAFDAFYDGAYWKDAVLNNLIVTHWIPLPELPESEGE